MSGVNVKFGEGRISYTAESAVKGGQVVEPGTAARTVKVAGTASVKILGVALTDAEPPSAPVAGVLIPTTKVVAVASRGCVPVVSDGSAAVGDLVVAGTAGAVKKATSEGVGAIVGRVKEVLSSDAKSVLVDLGL